MGIFDTRSWDALYKNWLNNKGQNPGIHPDPNCIWNTDHNKFFMEELLGLIKLDSKEGKIGEENLRMRIVCLGMK